MKTKTKLLSWALQILVALILGSAIYPKFTSVPETVALFEKLGMEPGGRYLIGAVELTVVILLLVPSSAAWGAILGWGVMTGAIIAHVSKIGITGEMLPMLAMSSVTWIACATILYIRRSEIGFIRSMAPSKPKDKIK